VAKIGENDADSQNFAGILDSKATDLSIPKNPPTHPLQHKGPVKT